MNTLNVLIVEDSEDDAALIVRELNRSGWGVEHLRVDTPEGMAEALAGRRWDVIIADFSLPRFSGMLALQMARLKASEVPFIVVSGTIGEGTAVEAMRSGADDYLFKGNLNRLVAAVQREVRATGDRLIAKKNEKLLRARELQLAEALQLARLGTWHLDLPANLADWSPEACAILGLCSETDELTFDQFLSRLEPLDQRTFKAAFADPSVFRIAYECRLAAADGRQVYVSVRGRIERAPDGNAITAGGMIQDITDRRIIDTELLQLKERAEAANRAKSEFLANMSHELRTPMSAILGFAEMMTHTGEHAIGQRECVATIRRNAQHLLELINEILDLSKIEAGQLKVERIECDLPALLSDVVALMQPRAADKSLQATMHVTGSTPRFIRTDPLRLRQILMNLLGNAIKFTQTGSISMTVGSESRTDSDRIIFEIRDTGIGMTSEQMSRIFQPFAQAEDSTTRKFGGTGLGLTISRRLVRLLDGDITVSSKVGVGSVFTVMIDAGKIRSNERFSSLDDPVVRARDLRETTAKTSICARILLAEDGRDNQRLLSTHLKMAGADVEIADNGQLVVDRMAAEKFDLILMDMQMPIMDGYTATAELRHSGVTIPIIALTAYAMAEDRAKCLASGCSDYLSKPVAPEMLLNTILKHLGQPADFVQPVTSMASQTAATPAPAPPATGTIRSTLIDYPGLTQIIKDFIADLPGVVRQLEQFLENQELDRLRRLCHQMRGACGGFGFDCLSEAAAIAEDAIRSAQPPLAISYTINSLIEIIRRVEGFDRKESRKAA